MVARGHDCLVAVVKSVPQGEMESCDGFRLARHGTALDTGGAFANKRPADVLHLWTPRERVREFAQCYRERWGACAVVVHLEDDEEVLFERFTGYDPGVLRKQKETSWMHLVVPGLIHPTRHQELLREAHAVTLVYHTLGTLLPPGVVSMELPPIIDPEFFHSGLRNWALVEELGIAADANIIAYNGNDHLANFGDIRLLYAAIENLMEQHPNLYFLRTGIVMEENYQGLRFPNGLRYRSLGFVDRGLLPDLMRLADVFIQPGNMDAFNSHRLPAKVPEYLSLGRPLIIGQAGIGAELAAAAAAVVLPHMTVAGIVERVEWLLTHPVEAAALGQKGRDFLMNRFSGEKIADDLENLYQRVCAPATSVGPSSTADRTRWRGAAFEPRDG